MPALRRLLPLFVAVLALSFAVDCSTLRVQAKGAKAALTWNTDLSKSLEAAKQSKKFVLVDFYTDWCSMCKKMDKTTYVDPGLVSYLNEKFICVKLNAEDKADGEKEAEKRNVGEFPQALVYTSEGKMLGRITGTDNPKDYEAALEKLISKAK